MPDADVSAWTPLDAVCEEPPACCRQHRGWIAGWGRGQGHRHHPRARSCRFCWSSPPAAHAVACRCSRHRSRSRLPPPLAAVSRRRNRRRHPLPPQQPWSRQLFAVAVAALAVAAARHCRRRRPAGVVAAIMNGPHDRGHHEGPTRSNSLRAKRRSGHRRSLGSVDSDLMARPASEHGPMEAAALGHRLKARVLHQDADRRMNFAHVKRRTVGRTQRARRAVCARARLSCAARRALPPEVAVDPDLCSPFGPATGRASVGAAALEMHLLVGNRPCRGGGASCAGY